MKIKVVVILVIGLMVSGLYFWHKFSFSNPTTQSHPTQNRWPIFDQPMRVGTTPLQVAIARTQTEQEQGLSGQERFGDDKGMLFDFSGTATTRPGFWMKEMKFDLDFLWIKNNTIVAITDYVPAPHSSSDPLPLYFPPTDVDSILEVPAGFAYRHHIEIGDLAQLVK